MLLRRFGLATALLISACSSSEPTATPTPASVLDGGVAARDAEAEMLAGDATVDAGTTLDAATPDSGVLAEMRGSVFAISDVNERATFHRVGAYFVRSEGAYQATPDRSEGPCVISTFSAEDEGGTEEDVSAGAIEVRAGANVVNLAPDEDSLYDARGGQGALWNGGEEVLITARGDVVPAFSVMLTAPSVLSLIATSTTERTSEDVELRTDAPYVLEWGGRSTGTVIAYFDIAEAQRAFSITCSFDAALGRGEVPREALAGLPAGAGTYSFYVKSSSEVTAENFQIQAVLSTALIGPSGAIAEGTAHFR